jgi:hypothetical protein
MVEPDAVAAPFFVAAGLLAVAGFAKLRDPAPLARTVAAVGLPQGRLVARALGGCEVCVGVLALTYPRPSTALALASMYASFAAFLAYLIARKIPVSSCGCLGQRDAPPTLLHVVLNLGAVGTAVAVALLPIRGFVTYVFELSYIAVPFLLGCAAAGYLLYLIVAYLPTVFFAFDQKPQPATSAIDGRERSQ